MKRHVGEWGICLKIGFIIMFGDRNELFGKENLKFELFVCFFWRRKQEDNFARVSRWFVFTFHHSLANQACVYDVVSFSTLSCFL